MRFYGMVAVIAIGCSGEAPPADIEPTIPDPTTEDDTGTPIDTAPEGAYLDAAFFTITAAFGFDPDTAEHVQFAEAGEGLSPISLTVRLIDSSAQYDGVLTDDNSCTVTLETDDRLPIASWVDPAGAFTGFGLPAGATVRDQCQFYGLPADFAGDPGLHVTKWRYGVGIGLLDGVVEDELRAQLPPSEWDAIEPFLLGGILSSNLFPPTTGTGDGLDVQGFTMGYAVDGNFQIVIDGVGNPSPIPKDQVDQDVGVARGYYEVNLGPYQPGTFLATEPL